MQRYIPIFNFGHRALKEKRMKEEEKEKLLFYFHCHKWKLLETFTL